MTLQSIETPTLDDAELTKIVDRADEWEIRALIEKREMLMDRAWAEQSLEDRWTASNEFIIKREETIAFLIDLNNSKEDRVARLRKSVGSIAWTWESIVDSIEEKTKAFATEKLREKISSIPIVWDWIAWFFEETNNKSTDWVLWDIKKSLLWGILWFFWIKEAQKYFNGDYSDFKLPEIDVPTEWVESETDVEWEDWESEVVEKWEQWEESNDWVVEEETTIESPQEIQEKIEVRKSMYSSAALLWLRNTSWENFDNNQLHNSVFSTVEKLKFSTISEAYSQYLEDEKNENRYFELCTSLWMSIEDTLRKEEKDVVSQLESMVWTNARLTIKWNLSDIAWIVQDEEFKKYFWDYWQELWSKSYEELSYHDLVILLAYSMPSVFGYLASQTKNGLTTAYFWVKNEAKVFLEELSERSEVYVSPELLSAFSSITGLWFWDNSDVPVENNENYKQKVLAWSDKLSDIDKINLDKIIDFKDAVISNIKTDPLVSSFKNFDTLFDEGVNYSEIVSLYLLFDGKSDISNLDITSKIWMFWIIWNILNTHWNKEKFFTHLWNKAFDWLENWNEFFTEEESYFLLSNLNNYSKWVLEELLILPDNARRFVWQTLADQLSWGEYVSEYEWWLISLVIWAPVAAAAVPVFWLWFKIAAMWTSALWVSMALWKLNEMWTLKKIINDTALQDTKEKLDAWAAFIWEWSVQEYLDNHST